jgi:hypothetical protein
MRGLFRQDQFRFEKKCQFNLTRRGFDVTIAFCRGQKPFGGLLT